MLVIGQRFQHPVTGPCLQAEGVQLDLRNAGTQRLQPGPGMLVDGDEEVGVEVGHLHRRGPRFDEPLQVGVVLLAFEQQLEMIEYEQQVRAAVPLAEGRQVRGRHGFCEVEAGSRGRRRFVERSHQRIQRRLVPLVDEVKPFALVAALNATAPVGKWHHHLRRAARLLALVADAAAQQRAARRRTATSSCRHPRRPPAR